MDFEREMLAHAISARWTECDPEDLARICATKDIPFPEGSRAFRGEDPESGTWYVHNQEGAPSAIVICDCPARDHCARMAPDIASVLFDSLCRLADEGGIQVAHALRDESTAQVAQNHN